MYAVVGNGINWNFSVYVYKLKVKCVAKLNVSKNNIITTIVSISLSNSVFWSTAMTTN